MVCFTILELVSLIILSASRAQGRSFVANVIFELNSISPSSRVTCLTYAPRFSNRFCNVGALRLESLDGHLPLPLHLTWGVICSSVECLVPRLTPVYGDFIMHVESWWSRFLAGSALHLLTVTAMMILRRIADERLRGHARSAVSLMAVLLGSPADDLRLEMTPQKKCRSAAQARL